MYIAVSNANGWAKAKTEFDARNAAFSNSIVRDDRVCVKVWPCQDDAWCNSHGEVFNITGEGCEYRRSNGHWYAIDAQGTPRKIRTPA